MLCRVRTLLGRGAGASSRQKQRLRLELCFSTASRPRRAGPVPSHAEPCWAKTSHVNVARVADDMASNWWGCGKPISNQKPKKFNSKFSGFRSKAKIQDTGCTERCADNSSAPGLPSRGRSANGVGAGWAQICDLLRLLLRERNEERHFKTFQDQDAWKHLQKECQKGADKTAFGAWQDMKSVWMTESRALAVSETGKTDISNLLRHVVAE